ncbi:hypothetical protein GGI12_002622 [Dipsacomyces acuminosporus]|nr:hypothetical protein GGI12_002622 [Dipsacomyces acuminosporus]
MESAFGRLYRTSKLASYDPKVKQVYTTFSDAATQGDWGLKRTMPRKVYTRLVTIGALDTKEQITPFESANRQVMMVNAWKENFPQSRSPGSASSDNSLMLPMFTRYDSVGSRSSSTSEEDGSAKKQRSQRNLSTMARSEWKRFLEEARSRRAEWKQALEEGKFTPEETLAFMNATNLCNSSEDGVHRSPTYHDYVPASEELQVQGRILNRAAAGYAVAVQGIIAYLPLQGHASEEGFQYRDVKTFYVHSAKFDSQGRPDVVLGTRPHGARESSAVFDTGSRGGFGYSKSRRNTTSSLQNVHLGRIKDILRLNSILKDSKKDAKGKDGEGKESDQSGNTKESDAISSTIDLLNKSRRQ